MQQLSPRRLADWLADNECRPPVLLDVREGWEFELCSLPGALHMPMNEVPLRAVALDPAAATVVVCHHGMRSLQVAMFLERQGFSALYNLTGGIEAWADEVDSSMRRY